MLKRRLLALLTAFLFVVGCQAFGQIKELKFDEMNSKQKATWMNEVYSFQYDDYKMMAAMPNLTENQKKAMRTKKKVLTEVWPLINLYSGYVDTGIIPAVELESQIMSLLNRLIAKGGI
jgi:uncharacterized cupredoxin-like copper-binding protein